MLPGANSITQPPQHLGHCLPSPRLLRVGHKRSYNACCQRPTALSGLESIGHLPVLKVWQVADLPQLSPALVLLPVTSILVVLRLVAYSRLQFITAAMMSKWIPMTGARSLQIGGGTRELFYYPSGAVLCTFIGTGLREGLLRQAGVQAGLPVEVKAVEVETAMAKQPGSSVDTVVCLNGISTLQNQASFFRNVQRVLRPGGTFVFIETLKGKGIEAVAQTVLDPLGKRTDGKVLDSLKAIPGFSTVEWDIALEGQLPHAVGVAIKANAAEQPVATGRSERRQAEKAARRKASTQKRAA